MFTAWTMIAFVLGYACAGFGFDLSLNSPEGAFRAQGSAGMFAREESLPTIVSAADFHLSA